jgi:hypothetical protein
MHSGAYWAGGAGEAPEQWDMPRAEQQQQLGLDDAFSPDFEASVSPLSWVEAFMAEVHGMAALMTLMPDWMQWRLRQWPRAWAARRLALETGHGGGGGEMGGRRQQQLSC